MPINLLKSLIKKDDRTLWSDYIRLFLLGCEHFSYEMGKEDIKNEKTRLLEKAIRRNFMISGNLLCRLQKEFIDNNLSISMILDLIAAWKYIALLSPPLNEKQVSDIIGYIASPISRMIIALNNENPSIYLSVTSLVSAVIFLQFNDDNLSFIKTSRWSVKQKRSKLKGWLKNSYVLLSIVRSLRLKFKIAQVLNRLVLYEMAFQNNKQYATSFLDETKIFLYSIFQSVTVRRRSITVKGL